MSSTVLGMLHTLSLMAKWYQAFQKSLPSCTFPTAIPRVCLLSMLGLKQALSIHLFRVHNGILARQCTSHNSPDLWLWAV